MRHKGNIILVGLMGAGKTTVGRRLANTLGLEFVDSDHEIERHTGADIPWIFDIEGEEGFRRREQEMVEMLCQRQGIVLATGGGVILSEQNRKTLCTSGTVIYLCATVEQIYQRIARSTNRPLLQCADPKLRLKALYEQRDPLYREVADLVIKTDHHSVAYMTRVIMRRLDHHPTRRKAAS